MTEAPKANVNDMNMYEGLNLTQISNLDLTIMLHVDGSEIKGVFSRATNWSITDAVKASVKVMFDKQNTMPMTKEKHERSQEMAIYANALLAVVCHDHHIAETADDVAVIPCEYAIVIHEYDFITVFNFRTRQGFVAKAQEYTDLIETPDAIRHIVVNATNFEHIVLYIPQAKVVDNA